MFFDVPPSISSDYFFPHRDSADMLSAWLFFFQQLSSPPPPPPRFSPGRLSASFVVAIVFDGFRLTLFFAVLLYAIFIFRLAFHISVFTFSIIIFRH